MIELPLIGLTRFLVGGSAQWIDCEPSDAQRIYFANHASHLDTLLIWSALPSELRRRTHPVAAADYWGRPGPLAAIARRTLKVVLIERRRTHPVAAADYWGRPGPLAAIARRTLKVVLIERRRAGTVDVAKDALQPLRDALAEGRSLILFPEGTRGAGPMPGPFKSGLYNLAGAFPDVELVPAWLENPGRAWPKGSPIPVPIACAVRFGQPMVRIADEDREAFLQRARERVIALAS